MPHTQEVLSRTLLTSLLSRMEQTLLPSATAGSSKTPGPCQNPEMKSIILCVCQAHVPSAAAYLGTEASALLKLLLVREPTKRLGYGPNGSRNVQQHPFFRGINWKKLMDCELASPFKPTIQHDASVENFDRIWTDQAAEDSPPASPTKCADASNNIFQGFTYVEPSLLAATIAAAPRAAVADLSTD